MPTPAITVHTWAMPADTDHDLWAEPCVLPMARIIVEDLTSITFIPPGSIGYPLTPAGAAGAVADWIDYYNTVLSGLDRPYQNYAIVLMNWGYGKTSDPFTERNNTFALMKSVDDRVDIYGGFVGLTTNQKAADCNTYFTAGGVANLAPWTQDFMEALAAVPGVDPAFFMMDSAEDTVNLDIILPDPSPWSAMVADPRYSTELVDGIDTLEDLFTDSGVSVDTSQDVYAGVNLDFRNFALNTCSTAYVWAFSQAFIDPMVASFPNALTGDFNIVAADPTYRVQWGRATYETYDVPLDRPEWIQQPVFYPLIDLDFQGVGSSLADQCAKWGVTGSDNEEKYWNVYKAVVAGNLRASRHAAPNARVVPWMMRAGYQENLVPTLGFTFTLDSDKLAELYRICIDQGVTEFAQFFQSTAMLDFGSDDQYTDTLAAIQSAEAYAASLLSQEILAMDATGSFLGTVLERIRGYLDADETEKYTDDWIIRHVIGTACTDVLSRINLSADNPILMRHSISLESGTQYYQLPACLGEVWRVAMYDNFGNLIAEELPRGVHNPKGPNWMIEGNQLSIFPIPAGASDWDVLYMSNGDTRSHYSSGGGTFSSDLLTFTFGTPTLGELDRRAGAYTGQVLRLLPTAPGVIEERVIASHDPVAGTVTLRTPPSYLQWQGAWSGATAYAVNDIVTNAGVQYICVLAHTNQIPPNTTYWRVNTPYEIAPIAHESLYDAISCRAAMKLGAMRNISQTKAGAIALEYKSSIKTILDNVSSMQSRTGKYFDRDTDNMAGWRM